MKRIALLMALLLTVCFTLSSLGEMSDFTAQTELDLRGKTVILHSNDVHGAIRGYAQISFLKASYEALGAEVILVDAGDFSQGANCVRAYKGETAITMMNAASYDIVTLGNHEFDYGYECLMQNLDKAEFIPICLNTILDETGESMLPSGAVYTTRSGLSIGFFGVSTPETASKASIAMIKEMSFIGGETLFEMTQDTIDALKAQGADIIIGLTHMGVAEESAPNANRSLDLYAHVSGVDLIIDGHSHTVMAAGENGEPITSTGTQFSYIGAVIIDDATKTIEQNMLISTENVGYDSDVLAAAENIIAQTDALYGAPFAASQVELSGDGRYQETNFGDLVTDALIWQVAHQGGEEQFKTNPLVSVFNSGSIRANIPAGEFSLNDILTAIPFRDTVAVVYVTGADLLEALEASTFCTPAPIGGYPQTSGISWTLDTTVEYDAGELYTAGGKPTTYNAPAAIKRVSIQAINGEPFDPDRTYAVVTSTFVATGGDTYAALNRAYDEGFGFDTGIYIEEALAAYVSEALGGIVGKAYAAPAGRVTTILPKEP